MFHFWRLTCGSRHCRTSSHTTTPHLAVREAHPHGQEERRALRNNSELGRPVDTETAHIPVALQENLREGRNKEDVHQDWCEHQSWAFGNAYVARDDQRVIGIGDSVDLLMESTVSGLRDIFELKRPDMDVILYDSTHRNWYWSANTAKAIGQCHRYLDTLHRSAREDRCPPHRCRPGDRRSREVLNLSPLRR